MVHTQKDTDGNLTTAGQVVATGNITGGNILGGANVNATTHTGTTVSVTACKSCNHRKGAKLLKPARAPFKPDHFHLINKWKARPVQVRHRSWYQYLGLTEPDNLQQSP